MSFDAKADLVRALNESNVGSVLMQPDMAASVSFRG